MALNVGHTCNEFVIRSSNRIRLRRYTNLIVKDHVYVSIHKSMHVFFPKILLDIHHTAGAEFSTE